MNKILVISEIVDYISQKKTHFSLTKGFEFSKGLTKLESTVYYLTTGKDEIIENVNLININNINKNFMDTIKYIIFIRETNLIEIMEKNNILKNILFNKQDKKIAIKGDSIEWLLNKDYHKYFEKNNKNFIDFVINCFDMICCQTNELKEEGLARLKKTYDDKIIDKIRNKIFISRMGIPKENPLDKSINNPYTINHEYCVTSASGLKDGKALHPLYFIDPYLPYGTKKIENYNKKKYIIIYTGRIKIDNGKILYIMRDMMKKLGDEYELHIFPGRFNIPSLDVSVLSPKNGGNLQLLRDIVFHDSDNVIIHSPYDDSDKTKYLQYADIAIDFSQARPINSISKQGNAKLLEYCYYGIKVVCEKNINNSYIVKNGENGILLENMPSSDDFASAIKNISKLNYDRNKTINYIVNNHNWEIISKELFEQLKKN